MLWINFLSATCIEPRMIKLLRYDVFHHEQMVNHYSKKADNNTVTGDASAEYGPLGEGKKWN